MCKTDSYTDWDNTHLLTLQSLADHSWMGKPLELKFCLVKLGHHRDWIPIIQFGRQGWNYKKLPLKSKLPSGLLDCMDTLLEFLCFIFLSGKKLWPRKANSFTWHGKISPAFHFWHSLEFLLISLWKKKESNLIIAMGRFSTAGIVLALVIFEFSADKINLLVCPLQKLWRICFKWSYFSIQV